MRQQVLSLKRENSTLDTAVHEKERLVSQLQMRVAVMEQEIRDKDQLMQHSKEALEATQQQKVGAGSPTLYQVTRKIMSVVVLFVSFIAIFN